MTEAESQRLSEMNRTIGGLESTVKILTDTWRRQDKEASDGRRTLYDKIEKLIGTTAGLTMRVDGLTAELAALKRSASHHNDDRQQAIGSKKAIALVWSGIISVTSVTTAIVLELVHQFWGKH